MSKTNAEMKTDTGVALASCAVMVTVYVIFEGFYKRLFDFNTIGILINNNGMTKVT